MRTQRIFERTTKVDSIDNGITASNSLRSILAYLRAELKVWIDISMHHLKLAPLHDLRNTWCFNQDFWGHMQPVHDTSDKTRAKHFGNLSRESEGRFGISKKIELYCILIGSGKTRIYECMSLFYEYVNSFPQQCEDDLSHCRIHNPPFLAALAVKLF